MSHTRTAAILAATAAALGLITTGVASAAAQPDPLVDVDLCVDVDAAIDTGDTRLVDLDTDLRARIAAALDLTDDLTDDTALAAVRVDLGCTDPTDPEPTSPALTPTPDPEPTTPAEPTTEPPVTTDPAPTTGPDQDDIIGSDIGGGYSQLDDVPTGAAETGGGPA